MDGVSLLDGPGDGISKEPSALSSDEACDSAGDGVFDAAGDGVAAAGSDGVPDVPGGIGS